MPTGCLCRPSARLFKVPTIKAFRWFGVQRIEPSSDSCRRTSCVMPMVRLSRRSLTIDKARRTRHLAPHAICTFQLIPEEQDSSASPTQPDIVIPQRQVSHSRSPNRSTIALPRGSGAQAEHVDFGQYVDETPLTVASKMPLEIVMQLFRRMG